jgi:hypothetical protein
LLTIVESFPQEQVDVDLADIKAVAKTLQSRIDQGCKGGDLHKDIDYNIFVTTFPPTADP